MILLDLDASDERTIYWQIADRVKSAVASGVLSVRSGRRATAAAGAGVHFAVVPCVWGRSFRCS